MILLKMTNKISLQKKCSLLKIEIVALEWRNAQKVFAADHFRTKPEKWPRAQFRGSISSFLIGRTWSTRPRPKILGRTRDEEEENSFQIHAHFVPTMPIFERCTYASKTGRTIGIPTHTCGHDKLVFECAQKWKIQWPLLTNCPRVVVCVA